MWIALLTLLQESPPTAVPAVLAPVSMWTPTTIAAVIAGAATLIGAVATAAVQIIREVRATKQTVLQNAEAGAIAGGQRDRKLDAIATTIVQNAEAGAGAGGERDRKLDRIEVLVDGRYSQVLQELADMKKLLADLTGTAVDRAQATIAQATADEQHRRVTAAGGPTPERK